MKFMIVPVIAICLVPAPSAAEEPPGRSLMERGAELFFEGLRQEMEPALDNLRNFTNEFGPSMRDFLIEMGPALAEIAQEVQDWAAYEPPEILPNGDIIIRKKPDHDAPGPESVPDAEPDSPSGPTDI
jgi:hypothetical protein